MMGAAHIFYSFSKSSSGISNFIIELITEVIYLQHYRTHDWSKQFLETHSIDVALRNAVDL